MASGLDLLRKLGSGVRPQGAGERPGAGVRSAGDWAGASFAELLEQASADVRSGAASKDVSVNPRVQASLTDEQLARLARTADRVVAGGGTRALVRMEDGAVVLDAERRTVESSVELEPGAVVSGIDSYTEAPAAGAGERVQVPAASLSSASLVRVAAQREGPQDAG